MNYYPFHVGDYAAHTAHLEPMEDLAYRRMLDLYYLHEAPLLKDPAEVARLIRMRGNVAEVQAVLSEFFTPTEDGWRHTRCDAELDRMQDKQATSESKAAHESERMRRHRERRAELFAALRERGQVPAWDTPMKELQRLHDQISNAPETQPQREQAVSGGEPATAIPTPTPTPTPIEIQEAPPASRVPPADAGRKPRAIRRCPDDFDAEPLREWARSEAPRADFGRELAKFRDHTFQRAISDWPAAFRNWLRKASDDANRRPQSFMAEKKDEMAKWFKGTSLDTSTQQDYIDAAPLTLR